MRANRAFACVRLLPILTKHGLVVLCSCHLRCRHKKARLLRAVHAVHGRLLSAPGAKSLPAWASPIGHPGHGFSSFYIPIFTTEVTLCTVRTQEKGFKNVLLAYCNKHFHGGAYILIPWLSCLANGSEPLKKEAFRVIINSTMLP